MKRTPVEIAEILGTFAFISAFVATVVSSGLAFVVTFALLLLVDPIVRLVKRQRQQKTPTA